VAGTAALGTDEDKVRAVLHAFTADMMQAKLMIDAKVEIEVIADKAQRIAAGLCAGVRGIASRRRALLP
jgi:hypothetical protein